MDHELKWSEQRWVPVGREVFGWVETIDRCCRVDFLKGFTSNRWLIYSFHIVIVIIFKDELQCTSGRPHLCPSFSFEKIHTFEFHSNC